MANFISEDQIEQGLLQRLQHLHGFDVLDCHTENPDDLNDGSGRSDKREVIGYSPQQGECGYCSAKAGIGGCVAE